MGMLSTAAYILSMDVFGPIADNAGGIVEMSEQPESVRIITDRLDAVGNTTKALTKGYAMGSAALACFLLFGAYLDEISHFVGFTFDTISISVPEMIRPGLLAVLFPPLVGYLFRFVGYVTGNRMLGAEVAGAMVMFGTVTGVMMAFFLNNGGGAWDNAKKYVETGAHGGKNSEAHKASITGDTIGDPFKDTAGPSVHVLVKLLSTITLVLGPTFVNLEG